MELYIPPGCQTLDKVTELPQIRVGFQGFGNRGKSFAALTFPNPLVMNIDRGLGAHAGRADVIEAPFYDEAFCKTILPSFTGPNDKKDVILRWLELHGRKLKPQQTLIVDANTGIQNAYHKWFDANKNRFLTKSGEVDGFAEWKNKKNYYAEFVELLKILPCNVVFICHEVERKEKDGEYRNKIRPLLTGQFGDELETHFTDWFRQHCMDKPADVSKVPDNELKLWGGKEELLRVCSMFEGNTIYFWQVEGNDTFDAKCSSLIGAPRFIPAHYSSFVKYRRKNANNKII